MLKKLFFAIGIISLLFSTTTFSQKNGFGVGIIIGEPTGISVKKWLDNYSAIDGAVAWSFGKGSGFHLHADYLAHSYSVFKVSRGTLPLYYGIGARIGNTNKNNGSSSAGLGIRVPVGVAYNFANDPLDIFFEIVPVLNLAPATDFGINAGLGIRYFF